MKRYLGKASRIASKITVAIGEAMSVFNFFWQVEWGVLNGRTREDAFAGLSYRF